MKRKNWQIPVVFLLLLYHVLSAAVSWAPDQPHGDPTRTTIASASPTAQFTPASRPAAWIVLPTNTPATRKVTAGATTVSVADQEVANAPLAEIVTAGALPGSLPSPTTQTAPDTLPAPTPQTTPGPQASSVAHTVESGDTLSAIAKRYGVTVQAIVAANSLFNPDFLSVDQVLLIPVVARPAATVTLAP
jgi:LysM repeat protein